MKIDYFEGSSNLGVKNLGEDCWSQCNQVQGPCDHCGTGLCCRYGWGDTSGGCDGTVGVQGKGHLCSVAPPYMMAEYSGPDTEDDRQVFFIHMI